MLLTARRAHYITKSNPLGSIYANDIYYNIYMACCHGECSTIWTMDLTKADKDLDITQLIQDLVNELDMLGYFVFEEITDKRVSLYISWANAER